MVQRLPHNGGFVLGKKAVAQRRIRLCSVALLYHLPEGQTELVPWNISLVRCLLFLNAAP